MEGKRYIMAFESAAIATDVVAGNPDQYPTGTLIWAIQNATLHVVLTPGTLGEVTVV
jgi:hypothetical protein